MAEAGLPTPRNFLIEKESQVEEAAELVKVPCRCVEGPVYIMLPQDCGISRGILMIRCCCSCLS